MINNLNGIIRVNNASSVSVFQNCEPLIVKLTLVLLPLVGVQLFQPLVSENFQFFISLLELCVNGKVVCFALLLDCVLLVGLVPSGNSCDRPDLSRVATVELFTCLLNTKFFDGGIDFTRGLILALHFSSWII